MTCARQRRRKSAEAEVIHLDEVMVLFQFQLCRDCNCAAELKKYNSFRAFLTTLLAVQNGVMPRAGWPVVL